MNFLEIVGKTTEKSPDPWIIKYMPNKLENISGNPKLVTLANYYLINQNIPNMILTGPNGVGKQTIVKCLLKEYLGPHQKDASLIVYGAINRGKDVVSEKLEQKKTDKNYLGPNITNFVKRKLSLPKNMCKIIVIYDFDHMTREAQMSLRRIIEIYSEKVRFIFTCSDISNIIEAMQSRCVILKFSKLTDQEIQDVLINIMEKEGFTIDDEAFDLICLSAYGDLKRAINDLQVLSFSEKKNIESYYNIFNIPPLNTIHTFIKACLDSDSKTAYDIIQHLLKIGYNSNDILDILLKVTSFNQFKNLPKTGVGIRNGNLDPDLQYRFIKFINQCFYLTETTGSVTHLYYLISQLLTCNNHNVNTRSSIM